jgi:hypothetical protein
MLNAGMVSGGFKFLPAAKLASKRDFAYKSAIPKIR